MTATFQGFAHQGVEWLVPHLGSTVPFGVPLSLSGLLRHCCWLPGGLPPRLPHPHERGCCPVPPPWRRIRRNPLPCGVARCFPCSPARPPGLPLIVLSLLSPFLASGNLDKQTGKGSTALHYCCLTDNAECLKLLLRGKASIETGERVAPAWPRVRALPSEGGGPLPACPARLPCPVFVSSRPPSDT